MITENYEYEQLSLMYPDISQTMPGIHPIHLRLAELRGYTLVDINDFYNNDRARFYHLVSNKCVLNYYEFNKDNLCKLPKFFKQYYAREIQFTNITIDISTIDPKCIIDMQKIVFSNSTIINLHKLEYCKNIKFIKMKINIDLIKALNDLDLVSLCFENCEFTNHNRNHTLYYLKISTLNEFSINTKLNDHVKLKLRENHPNMGINCT